MSGGPPQTGAALWRALRPYLLVLLCVGATVFVFPGLTHWLRSAPEQLAPAAPDPAQVDELLRSMSGPRSGAQ